MPRVTYDYIKNLDPAFIGGLSKSEALDLLRKIRAKYNTRAKQLEKVSSSVYSPALAGMEDFYERVGKKAPSKMTRNQILNEIFNLQGFFQAESSTVAGARKIQREQDIRIFGETPSGRPKKRMTLKQREKFWSIYNEFISTFKTAEYLYGSNKIQQYLGQYLISSKKVDVDMDTLYNLESLLRDEQEEIYNGDYSGSVFSGTWSS